MEELKLHSDRLLAENSLLGGRLREAQADRKAQQAQLLACQAHNADLQQQLKESKARTASLQRQLEQLKVAGAHRDQHLEQSLAQREQLEALVHQLRAHVAQLAAELHEHQASRSHEAGGAAQAQGGAGVADDNALRKEVARLEDLYETKLQLVQQQADARVEEMQAQARERLQAAEADARAALAQLHEEVQRQVREAEAGMLRQLQQQDRLIQQLERRCAAVEGRVRNYGRAPSSAGAAEGALAAAGAVAGGRAGPQLLHHHQPQSSHAPRAQAAAAALAEAAAVAVSKHKQQAVEALHRVQFAEQELVAALEQHHALMTEHVELQHQARTATSNLAAAEAAIQDLRGALSSTREKLLSTQATTVAEAVRVAATSTSRPHLADVPVPQQGQHQATYIRVLEHALREADAREAALKRAVQEAGYLEEQARRLVGSARDEQLAMRRALEKQVQRCHALEEVRLRDAKLLASLHASSH